MSTALCHPRGHSPLSRLGLVDSSLYPCRHSPPPARSASALLNPHECYHRVHLTVCPVLVPTVTAKHDPHVHPTIAPGSLYELPSGAPQDPCMNPTTCHMHTPPSPPHASLAHFPASPPCASPTCSLPPPRAPHHHSRVFSFITFAHMIPPPTPTAVSLSPWVQVVTQVCHSAAAVRVGAQRAGRGGGQGTAGSSGRRGGRRAAHHLQQDHQPHHPCHHSL